MSVPDAVTTSTAFTALTWRWVASSLLNIAELGLVSGCVPRRAPSASTLGLPQVRVNPLDAPPPRAFYDKVAAAYKQWTRVPLCRPRPGAN